MPITCEMSIWKGTCYLQHPTADPKSAALCLSKDCGSSRIIPAGRCFLEMYLQRFPEKNPIANKAYKHIHVFKQIKGFVFFAF